MVFEDQHESALEGVMTVDEDGLIVELNAAAEEMFGLSRDAAIGGSMSQIIPPELRAASSAGMRRVAGGGPSRMMDQRWHFEGVHSDGSTVPIELFVSRTGSDPQRFTAWMRDLTRRSPTAGELLAARAEIATRTGSYEMYVPTGEVLWSDNFFRVLGLAVGEVEPSAGDFLERVHPDDADRVEGLVDRLDDTDGQLPNRFRILRPNGEVCHLESTLTIVEREGDEVTRVIGSIQDVTEIRGAEREVAAHRAVILGLREWTSLDASGRDLLCELCRPFDAAVGAIWIPRGDVLECHVVWPSRTLPRLEIVDATLQAHLPRGSGLPGAAWGQSETVSASSAKDFDFDRARLAAETGLDAGIAFPVIHSGETLMVVELLAHEQIELTESLSLSLAAIGHQIGQFMARRRGELVPLLLTPRELQLLECAADGLSGPMIAEHLTISPATVKTHFENIYAKLGVPDRASAVAEVLRLGLFE